MTTAEMLASVEAQIRKDIPRLMELREGCYVMDKITECVYRVYKVTDKIYKLCGVTNDDNWDINKKYFDSSVKIIGHDIMLNDVLEWLRNCKRKIEFDYKTGYFLDEFDYYYSFSSNYHENAPIENKIWNLSFPYLKDQPEKLIKFLYNLKKE